MTIDWVQFATALLTGAATSALFFAGLGFGLRYAVRTDRPAAVLLMSSALRIALLLAVGWWVSRQGAAAFIGFSSAFLITRTVILAAMRPSLGAGRG